jgi:predicted dehydrogenase
MTTRTIRVGINGTGFAADYTSKSYAMMPHRNGVTIELAGVVSGRLQNAQKFAE